MQWAGEFNSLLNTQGQELCAIGYEGYLRTGSKGAVAVSFWGGMSVCRSVGRSVCLSACLSVCLSVWRGGGGEFWGLALCMCVCFGMVLSGVVIDGRLRSDCDPRAWLLLFFISAFIAFLPTHMT
jgi:hypothetical protein